METNLASDMAYWHRTLVNTKVQKKSETSESPPFPTSGHGFPFRHTPDYAPDLNRRLHGDPQFPHLVKKKNGSAKGPCPNMDLTSMSGKFSCPNLDPTCISPTGHFVRMAPDLWDQNDPNLSDFASNIYGKYPGSLSL